MLPADSDAPKVHEPSCSLPHGHHDIGLDVCLLARPVNLKAKFSHVYTWFSLSAPMYPGSPLLGSWDRGKKGKKGRGEESTTYRKSTYIIHTYVPT